MARWTLYWHPISPACQAVRVVIRYLGLDDQVQIRLLDLMRGEQRNPQFVAINGLHQVPTLVEHEGDGENNKQHFVLTESRPIMTYLCAVVGNEKAAAVYPSGQRVRASVDRWMYMDVTCLWHRLKCYHLPVITRQQQHLDSTHLSSIAEALEVIDQQLKAAEECSGETDGECFLVGNSVTLADLGLVTTINQAKTFKIDMSRYAHINSWYERVASIVDGFDSLVEGNETYAKMIERLTTKR